MAEQPLSEEPSLAERAGPDEIQAEHSAFAKLKPLRKFMDAMPNMVMVLNGRRQIVFFNRLLDQALEFGRQEAILGKRPGEFLGCVHSEREPDGCGTTGPCGVCGMVKAFLESLKGSLAIEECRIATKDPGRVFDLRVWATPYTHHGVGYCILALKDISHEKRRQALEKIFFHDVLNTAGALRGLSEVLSEASGRQAEDIRRMLHDSALKLVEEIHSQRDLRSAEKGELVTKPVQVSPREFLKDMAELYRNHEAAKDRILAVAEGTEEVSLATDRTLLSRVVGNMIKNALEASPPGATVTLGWRKEQETVVFSVHNARPLSGEIRLQLFQRSFSTKGAGRGLGTYSMRLLTQAYLKGRVWFESSASEGTTFYAGIPLEPR